MKEGLGTEVAVKSEMEKDLGCNAYKIILTFLSK